MFAVNFDLVQLLGPEYFQLVRLPGRKLQDKRYRIRKAYNKSLRDNIRRHKLTEKYQRLYQSRQTMTHSKISQEIHKLDKMKTEFMRCAESRCKKKCAGKLPCSPKVSFGSSVYGYLTEFASTKSIRYLTLATCIAPAQDSAATVTPCRYSSPKIILARILSIKEHIELLKPITPKLRTSHIQERWSSRSREQEESPKIDQ